MSIHNRVRPFGFWHTGSTITSGEFERLDDNGAYSVSATGGTYAMADLLTLGGTAGVTITAPFNATDAKYISVDTTLQMEVGSIVQLFGNMLANSGAIVGITSGAFITVARGGTLQCLAGSTTTLNGTTTVGGALTIGATGSFSTNASAASTINGAITINSVGTFTKGLTVTQSTANTAAITATGNGTAAGATLTGGATAPGLTAVNGTPQTNTAPTCAGQFAGYIQITGTIPNQGIDPGANNVIHGGSICHARCSVEVGTGGPYTPDSSYNIDTVVDVATGIYHVELKRAMGSNQYTAVVSCNDYNLDVYVTAKTTLVVTISVVNAVTRALSASAVKVDLLVFGTQ